VQFQNTAINTQLGYVPFTEWSKAYLRNQRLPGCSICEIVNVGSYWRSLYWEH